MKHNRKKLVEPIILSFYSIRLTVCGAQKIPENDSNNILFKFESNEVGRIAVYSINHELMNFIASLLLLFDMMERKIFCAKSENRNLAKIVIVIWRSENEEKDCE